jgi:hypothetical protein
MCAIVGQGHALPNVGLKADVGPDFIGSTGPKAGFGAMYSANFRLSLARRVTPAFDSPSVSAGASAFHCPAPHRVARSKPDQAQSPQTE